MSRWGRYGIWWGLLLPTVALGQSHAIWHTPPQQLGWMLAAQAQYTESKLARAWYPAWEATVGYEDHRFGGVAKLKLNQGVAFSFPPPTYQVEVQGGTVVILNEESRAARPARYQAEQPIQMQAYWKDRIGTFGLKVSALDEQFSSEKPVLEEAGENLFVLTSVPIAHRKTTFFGALMGAFSWGPVVLRAGVTNVPLFFFGDERFNFAYQPRLQPVVGLAWRSETRQVGGAFNVQQVTVGYRQRLPQSYGLSGYPAVEFGYRTSLQGYAFQHFAFGLEAPLSSHIQVFGRYEWVRGAAAILTRRTFLDWQDTSLLGSGEDLNNTLPHQTVEAGLRLSLYRKKQALPVQLADVQWLQNHLYRAKAAFYANNPVGFVRLFNPTDAPVQVYVNVETTTKAGQYQSEPVAIGPSQMVHVPLYLYLRNTDEAPEMLPEQVVISAKVQGQQEVLTTLPVTVYGPNAWAGDTWELQYFLAPQDPAIRGRAEQVYRYTLGALDSTATPAEHFAAFKTLVQTIGQGLAYIPDPTTTFVVDQVQYPVETMALGSGDCEDLTVFLASSLMAVGRATALVDLRPTPTQVADPESGRWLGHVFLLVDTGLPPAALAAMGLSELQGITRQSVNGQYTVWLPIEPSLIGEGFDVAFRAGFRQYYREVVEKNGIAEGAVQVYDW